MFHVIFFRSAYVFGCGQYIRYVCSAIHSAIRVSVHTQWERERASNWIKYNACIIRYICVAARIRIHSQSTKLKHCIRLAITSTYMYHNIYFLYYYFHVIFVYFHFELVVAVVQRWYIFVVVVGLWTSTDCHLSAWNWLEII